jgi:5'-nucleotidase
MVQDNIYQTLLKIEKAGNYPPPQSLEMAYLDILQYLVRHQIAVEGYDWHFMSNLDSFKSKIEPIIDLHRSIYNPTSKLLTSLPLEVFLFFKTLDKVIPRSETDNNQKIVYVDMDGVIVDFPSAFQYYDSKFLEQNPDKDEIEGIFGKMHPLDGALPALDLLYRHFDVFLLSTSPWNNPSAWRDKIEWVQKHLPIVGYKRLILSHHKNLNIGDYLIDDRLKNGTALFKGEHIHFGSKDFPNWAAVTGYLMSGFVR